MNPRRFAARGGECSLRFSRADRGGHFDRRISKETDDGVVLGKFHLEKKILNRATWPPL